MPYSAPLDGIRAIAILAVLVFHVVPASLKGGFTGVDVFFVLSGFLITSVIVHDIREGSFSLREFYLRRVQRLMPNIVATVLATTVLWTLFFPPSGAQQAGRHGLWTLGNLSNVFIWRNFGGYWGDAAETAPLLHTWSLAIEEQFYLLFPSTLVLLARFQRSRLTAWLLAVTIGSFALCLVAASRFPVAGFYMLPTRVWELLLGAALATHWSPLHREARRPLLPSRWAHEVAGWLGLALVVAGFFLIDEAGGFPRAVALLPTLGTALVIVSVTEDTSLARLLSARFMVATGKLSYSLYLWHWPLITLGKAEAELRGQPAVLGAVVGAVAGVLLSIAAYFWVEKPLRARGPGRGWRLATVAAGFAVVLGGSTWVARSLPRLDTAQRFDAPEFRGLLFTAGKVDRADASAAIRYRDVRFPDVRDRADDAWRQGGFIPGGRKGGPPAVVVLGSSHALMYSSVIDEICRRHALPVAFLGVDQTPAFFRSTVNASFPTTAVAREFDDTRLRLLRTWSPRALLVIDRWDGYGGREAAFEQELRTFLATVSPLAGTVVLVAQVPAVAGGDAVNLRELVAWKAARSSAPPRLVTGRDEAARVRSAEILEKVAGEFANVRVLRPDRIFLASDGTVRWGEGRTFYYADDDHLSEAGAQLARPLLEGALEEAALALSPAPARHGDGRQN
jgi:peptidoglycan/LPS O-acetylase OafA/YrhL